MRASGSQSKMPPPRVSAAASKATAPGKTSKGKSKGKGDAAIVPPPVITSTNGRMPLRRDRSGLTVSPQEAFLDYYNVEAAITSSGAQIPGSTAATGGGMHSVFAPDPPGLGNALAGDGIKGRGVPFSMASRAAEQAPGASSRGARTDDRSMLEDTPSLTGGSSTSSREDSTVASPPAVHASASSRSAEKAKRGGFDDKLPLAATTSRPLVATALIPDGSTVPRGSQSSGMSMFKNESFNGSATSTSTPDDEDEEEKPYFPVQPGRGFGQFGEQHKSAQSSSEEETASGSRSASFSRGSLMPPGKRPLTGRRTPGSFGGYGYIPGSADSGLSYQEPAPAVTEDEQSTESFPGQDRPLAFHGMTSMDERNRSDGGSNDDDGSISPSIRSSAQAVNMHPNQAAALAAAAAAANGPRTTGRKSKSRESSASSLDGSGDEDEDDGSDFEDGKRKPGPKRKRPRTSGAGKGKTATTAGSPSGRQTKTAQAAGSFQPAERVFPTSRSGMTVCDYVSPLSGEYCGTEFHRMYDLTRHRETIHAKEEAKAVRQKWLTLEQCLVLGKEVDPKTSSATVEWKCEGRNGCGSVFSVSARAERGAYLES